MNNLINNEALVGCVAFQILKLCPSDFSKLSIQLMLLMDDNIRNSISRNNCLFFEESIFRDERPETLDRLYLEMLPVCLNSLVILIQDGLVESEANILSVTDKGLSLSEEILSIHSQRLAEINTHIPHLVGLTANYSATELFKALRLSV